ncbi:MAG: hypothetical protein GTN62_12240 [Gemmatimonadales bacterium]|nr:hypothetical protein [Gemmatimonadales bacterium]NIN12494.1 hypothetical protein [Gemmatimonadales bacterium]NIN50865.1 hypothetical protein [Gemmatimonadales bacterium]NIP08329.1 hypothetical protein [Gemmatimonadales bacterium]NIR03426.1 hypothetical protein [Gemmatimonadales bacterium]
MAGSSAIERALVRSLERARSAARVLNVETARYIIFSDHHKGQRDGADDFARCERAYIGALKHYNREGYTLIVLGDAEELWECRPKAVMRAYANILKLERQFHPQRYVRVYGNHDDEWERPRRVNKHLGKIFGPLDVSDGLCFRVQNGDRDLGLMLLVHGHQGTLFSDRLAGIAKLVVRFIWRTIQRLTRLPSTTPAKDACLRDDHDAAMYDWAAKQDGLVLIAGHTHRPVFSSKTHLRQVEDQLAALENTPPEERGEDFANQVATLRAKVEHVRTKDQQCQAASAGKPDRSSPCYFNSGCCSFGDGDITGLEIVDGQIRLVRWPDDDGSPRARVLVQASLADVFASLR